MTSTDIRHKVRCGACHGSLGSGPVCFVALRRKATWRYPSSCNFLTGEDGLATAVVCEKCIDAKKDILEAVEFANASDVPIYHPIEDLEAINDPKVPDRMILCMNVDPTLPARLGLPAYQPRAGFLQTECEQCHAKVWIGPRQTAMRRATGMTVWCAVCVARFCPERTKEIQGLGG